MDGNVTTKEKGIPDKHAYIIEKCINQLGRWQILVFLLVSLVNIPLSMQELAIVFLAPPQHSKNYTCTNKTIIDPCSKSCPSREFDTSIFTNTIISQWDLTCDNFWLESFSQTILMLGVLCGHMIFGFLSDHFGRRKPLVAAAIMQVLTGVGIAFVPTIWLFMLLRFLVAVAAGGTLTTSFVYVVEIIGRKYRQYFCILFQMTYYLGHSLLGLLAFYIRDWRYLQLTVSLLAIFLISYFWLLPESPRWLLTVGKYEEAIQVMEKAAKINGMPTEHISQTIMKEFENVKPPEEHFTDLLRTPNIRNKSLCIFFNWIVLGLSFFGVAQYMGQIGGDIFLNTSLAGLIQIPGNAILLFTIGRFGRKNNAVVSYGLCGITLIIIAFLPTAPSWVITALGSISMMSISISFATVFLWSGEIFPTVVRNIGMGSSATCAKFGSMIAPFIEKLSSMGTWIPPVIFGVAPLLALVVCFMLPETIDTVLPDTIEEAEKFGKNK